MTKSDLKEFTAFLMAIAEVYNRKITDTVVLMYFDALTDLDFRAVKAAVKRHCQDPEEGRFFPLVAHIRKYACSQKTGLLAWSEVLQATSKYGYYDTVQFQDGVINAVIRDMGGWERLCEKNFDEPWTQKEFERMYDAYRAAGCELHEPLIGKFERENRSHGYLDYVPDVKLIGEGGDVTLLPAKDTVKQLTEGDQIVQALVSKMTM